MSQAVLSWPCRSFFLRSQPLAAETFRFYAPPRAAAPADQPGVFCEAELVIMGLSKHTVYHLYDPSDFTAGPIESGVVDRFKTVTISPSGIVPSGYYQLETSDMVLAYLGDDCLGQGAGGSFFYPTEDGRSFIGRDFVVNIPVLGPNSEFVVFAYQNANVRIENTSGKLVASNDMTSETHWKPSGLQADTFYVVHATGHIALQSNALNGYTSVPGQHTDNLSSCYNNAATKHLFATWDNDQNSVLVLSAYENASLVLWDLTDPKDPGTDINLSRGETWRQPSPGTQPGYWLLESTNGGRVSIQAGLEEDANILGYVGDDIDFNMGFEAHHFYVHSMAQGGYIFANQDDATVEATNLAGGTSTRTIDATEYWELEPLFDWEIQSVLPILIETIGGVTGTKAVELNDFGTFVPPIFSVDRNANNVQDHQEDLDHDGNPNACDWDGDGDGIADKHDRCPHTAASATEDLDKDGCPDSYGSGGHDSDGDGIPDDQDACPDVPEDMDNDFDDDGCPETAEDSDGDGVYNEIDNCPHTYNPGQADSDGDGIGDACEGDPGVGATGAGAVFSCSAIRVGGAASQEEVSSSLLALVLGYLSE